MRDLFESWIFKRSLLETLESRYFFSAGAGADASAGESVVLIDKNLPKESLLTRAIRFSRATRGSSTWRAHCAQGRSMRVALIRAAT